MILRFRFLILIYCLLIDFSRATRRTCYRCLVQEKCLSLDKNAENATRKCPEGVEHCVISRITSKVTGAEAVDYMCGGRVYDVPQANIKDGCFESVEDPGARTKRIVCYCSSDLCNSAGRPIISLLSLCFISTFISRLLTSISLVS